MIKVEQLLVSVRELPTLPGNLAHLARLGANATAKDFESAIRPDPAMTMNLLRLANSPYFGLRRSVNTLKQAVIVLGTRRVFQIATATALSHVVPEQLVGYEVNAEGFWHHCIATAVATEQLALVLGPSVRDAAFTAGLLHDVGKLAVATYLQAEADAVLTQVAEGEMTFVAAEQLVLGTDHAVVGAMVAEHWDLPSELIQAVRWHHQPDAPPGGPSMLIDLVHVANAVAHVLGFGSDSGHLAREIDPAVERRLALSAELVERVMLGTAEAVTQMTEG